MEQDMKGHENDLLCHNLTAMNDHGNKKINRESQSVLGVPRETI